MDVDQLVKHDIFKVNDETASSGGGIFGEDAKKFHDALKGVVNKLVKLHKDVITFQWKIKKRVSAPAGALSLLNEFRNLVSDTLTFYQQFLGSELETYLDVDKVAKLLTNVTKEGHTVPPRLAVIFFHARTLDFIQFNRIDDLAKLMGIAEPIAVGITVAQQQGPKCNSRTHVAVSKQSCTYTVRQVKLSTLVKLLMVSCIIRDQRQREQQ